MEDLDYNLRNRMDSKQSSEESVFVCYHLLATRCHNRYRTFLVLLPSTEYALNDLFYGAEDPPDRQAKRHSMY